MGSLSIFLGLCSSLTIYLFTYSLIDWFDWLGPLRRNSLSFSQRELHFFRVGSHLPVKQKQVVILLKLLSQMQGILKGEVSLYHWPPIWLIWIQLYDKRQFLFLFAKQTIPSVKQEVNSTLILPPFSIPCKKGWAWHSAQLHSVYRAYLTLSNDIQLLDTQ